MAFFEGKTHVILPDIHAKPGVSNDRADWFGKLIRDVKPDVVINGGDAWDMESLSSYDKGKASFYGKSYNKDIDSGLEFEDRLWSPLKRQKKRLPQRVFLLGNHEYRINRLLEYTHELEGTVGMQDLQLEDNYDVVVPYEGSTPGQVTIDGVNYAHFFISGVKGYPVGGMNPARSLLQKKHESCTSFHLHLYDHAMETTASGKQIFGFFAGVGHDHNPPYAGIGASLWRPGCAIKRFINPGSYDLEFISLARLKKAYENA